MRACGGNVDAQVGLRTRNGRNGRPYLPESTANKNGTTRKGNWLPVDAAQTAAAGRKAVRFFGVQRPPCKGPWPRPAELRLEEQLEQLRSAELKARARSLARMTRAPSIKARSLQGRRSSIIAAAIIES